MGFADAIVVGDRLVRETLGDDHVLIYVSGTEPDVPFAGIFDPAYVRVQPNGEPGVSSVGPAVFLTLADITTDPAEEDGAVSVDGVMYTVHEVQKDGCGGCVLLLHRE